MAKNKGKEFEADFKQSCVNSNLFVMRIHDTSLSWMHEKESKFTAENPCDFLLYDKPNLFAVECKSTKYKSMSIQTDITDKDDKSMIKSHQINSLTNFNLYDGVYGGFLLNWRNDEDISDNRVYWLPIENFVKFLTTTDKKSINEYDCQIYGGILVDQHLKRTHYLYDINKLIDDIIADTKKDK